MGVDKYRYIGERILLPLTKRMDGVNPDALSWAAFFTAVAAGIFFSLSGEHHWYLLIAGGLVFLNALLDALDGIAARMQNLQGPRGDYLDHVLDRYADIFMYGGIALSSLCDTVLGFVGVISVIMASYMGTQAHAVGGKRDYSGFGRADRLIAGILGAWFEFVFLEFGGEAYPFHVGNLSVGVLEIVIGFFIILSIYTIFKRGYATWRHLTDKEK